MVALMTHGHAVRSREVKTKPRLEKSEACALMSWSKKAHFYLTGLT